jgi:hypothetical protein
VLEVQARGTNWEKFYVENAGGNININHQKFGPNTLAEGGAPNKSNGGA